MMTTTTPEMRPSEPSPRRLFLFFFFLPPVFRQGDGLSVCLSVCLIQHRMMGGVLGEIFQR